MSPTVHVPDSVPAVLEALDGGGVLLAGGTAVMPVLNTTAHDVEALVSLRRAGLAGIEVEGTRAIVGAATTLAALGRDERLAVLRPVVESIASPSIRNLATVGGNLFVRQPYGDLAVALLALGAEVDLAGGGTRGVGQEGTPGELVTAVAFDVPERLFYTKAMRRRQNSASIVTVAAVVTLADGVVTHARIALGGAGPRPVLADSVAAALEGKPLDRPSVEAAAAAADAECFDDAYASAWYRRRVLPVHIRRALLGE